MNHFSRVPVLLGGTIIIPLIAAYRFHSIAAYVVLAIWIGAAYWLGIRSIRSSMQERLTHRNGELQRQMGEVRQQNERLKRENLHYAQQHASMQQQNEAVHMTAIEAFSHHRHDWMNDLQLLYGYIQLGNKDKLVENIERIKEQMMTDSRVSKLGIPSLIFYLQSFKAVNRDIQLEVEIEDGITLEGRLGTEQSEELTRVIQETISAYQTSGGSSWGECPTLSIIIRNDDDEVQFIFEPEEVYPGPDQIWAAVNQLIEGTTITATRPEDDPASISLHIYPVQTKTSV
ncbi:Spo0B domain-containing protein [Paenibacillus wulumuqiensis]|uniref:Spo0B domain-containing protein n=1 Tax=Paenibacillus wulumuqiensis TaxID=1567107 RepID=UPI000698B35F|nr:Spo0B domain-containing protein [Paenibacillus wulumuqiensis]